MTKNTMIAAAVAIVGFAGATAAQQNLTAETANANGVPGNTVQSQ